MVFNIGAVAGPSRLPLLSRAAFNVARRCASGKAPADDVVDAQADVEAAVDVESDVAPQEEKGALGPGYHEWLTKVADQYRDHRPGQKALWLGGSIPFPQNPTFRPPPPLSNDLQNLIYERKNAGETLGQLSQAFGLSKARIEAVLKLKEVELQFRRQNKTLQTAFLEGMEPLLGVQSPMKNKVPDIVSSRQEQQARDEHPSGHVELAEEERFEKGVGAGGAFGMGDLMPGQQAASEETGMEGLAWEFRAEDDKGFKPTPFNRNPPIVAETGENLAEAAPITPTPTAPASNKSRVNGEYRFINTTEISTSASMTTPKTPARKKQAKA